MKISIPTEVFSFINDIRKYWNYPILLKPLTNKQLQSCMYGNIIVKMITFNTYNKITKNGLYARHENQFEDSPKKSLISYMYYEPNPNQYSIERISIILESRYPMIVEEFLSNL